MHMSFEYARCPSAGTTASCDHGQIRSRSLAGDTNPGDFVSDAELD